MKIHAKSSLFVPDGTELSLALKRTTTLCIAAHQDDTEIMAYHAIAGCYQQEEKWFTSVIVTDGAGSPRAGVYEHYTDEQMQAIRMQEQTFAARIGRYSVQAQLGYASKQVKDGSATDVVDDLAQIVRACSPDVVITHNLADKHDTHVAVALRTVAALRRLERAERPKQLLGMEVWRSLDWLPDEDKLVLDASERPGLAAALLGVFDSQVSGGKRYDLATTGRRRANATFAGDHSVDEMESAAYGVDMTALMHDETLTPQAFMLGHIDAFGADVQSRIQKML